jgi:hypothetical protein
LGSWINRDCIYPYCSIWILTLKRIYAEGLQQRGRRKEIAIWRIGLIGIETGRSMLNIRGCMLAEGGRSRDEEGGRNMKDPLIGPARVEDYSALCREIIERG